MGIMMCRLNKIKSTFLTNLRIKDCLRHTTTNSIESYDSQSYIHHQLVKQLSYELEFVFLNNIQNVISIST